MEKKVNSKILISCICIVAIVALAVKTYMDFIKDEHDVNRMVELYQTVKQFDTQSKKSEGELQQVIETAKKDIGFPVAIADGLVMTDIKLSGKLVRFSVMVQDEAIDDLDWDLLKKRLQDKLQASTGLRNCVRLCLTTGRDVSFLYKDKPGKTREIVLTKMDLINLLKGKFSKRKNNIQSA